MAYIYYAVIDLPLFRSHLYRGRSTRLPTCAISAFSQHRPIRIVRDANNLNFSPLYMYRLFDYSATREICETTWKLSLSFSLQICGHVIERIFVRHDSATLKVKFTLLLCDLYVATLYQSILCLINEETHDFITRPIFYSRHQSIVRRGSA